jgi:hypothetical protein
MNVEIPNLNVMVSNKSEYLGRMNLTQTTDILAYAFTQARWAILDGYLDGDVNDEDEAITAFTNRLNGVLSIFTYHEVQESPPPKWPGTIKTNLVYLWPGE